uniref:DEAD/DEAH box helicase n=1 Tax=Aureimonas psammosilenae TaxID=2495496 RepID=UPI001AEDB181
IVLIDEAHRVFQFLGDWMAMPAWASVPFVGLSATPWAKGLGKLFDDLIVAATTAELIEKGFLSPFRVFAPAHPDLSKVRTARGDYHEGDLSEVMSEPVLIADTVATWLRLGENRPTLLFAVDRAHARRLAAEFEAAGVATGYVDANTPRDERELVGQRLRNGQIRVVCNVGCLTTGVDWDVRAIILARPTKSEMLFVQIIGRGLRTADGKDDCLILDHSDTTLRLGFVSDIHHETLDGGKHQTNTAKAREKAVPLPKECPSCSFLKPPGMRQCSACGFLPERQSAIEEKAGSLIPINGKRKGKGEATGHTPQEVYSMLIWTVREKGYKPGYAAAKFKDRYGVWPRGLDEVPLPPDAAFLNWMKSQQIAWARSKKRRQEANGSETANAA